ncbi:transposase [Burkholderia ubonensis]|uniref:transposase n=1 Tax=Burkholderia ubonensis TaxID=101571 RepID=UPI0039F470EF
MVARRNDVNTNLLFRWRRQYLEGAFGPPRPEHVDQKPTDGIPTLLPVSIVDEPPPGPGICPDDLGSRTFVSTRPAP